MVLGVLALACGAIVSIYADRYALPFEGRMYLQEGGTERIAVSTQLPTRLHAEGAVIAPVHPSDIPFSNPALNRTVLDPNQMYAVAVMPFAVTLARRTVLEQPAPVHRLHITSAGQELEVDIAAGTALEVAGHMVRVADIGPWAGLWPDSNGVPMAQLVVESGAGVVIDPVFLHADRWVQLQAGAALLFRWFDGEAAAEAEVAAELASFESGRWGVVEGRAVHWLGNFQPGTGVDLRDGRSVTLIETGSLPERPGTPGIRVAVERSDGVSSQWVPANAWDDSSLVRYELPTAQPAVVVLGGFPGGAWATAYKDGVVAATARLTPGTTWKPRDMDVAIRLEALEARAVAIEPAHSPLYRADIDVDGTRVRVRQAETVTHKSLRLHYSRIAPPPVVAYAIEISREGGAASQEVAVNPGDSIDIQGWRIAQAPPDPGTTHLGVLHIERQQPLRAAGPALAALGVAGLLFGVLLQWAGRIVHKAGPVR